VSRSSRSAGRGAWRLIEDGVDDEVNRDEAANDSRWRSTLSRSSTLGLVARNRFGASLIATGRSTAPR
jgi:hypothetical protein